MGMVEIKITLETLYDIFINEKKREDLQNLNESFFFDVVNYLKEKKMLLDNKQDEDDLFAAGEREKLEYELRSIKRILKEIYEKREKKIIDIALNKSRTQSDIIDTSTMLKEEKDFYDQLIKLLDGYREGILLSLFKGEIPMFQRPKIEIGKVEPEKPSSDGSVLNVEQKEPQVGDSGDASAVVEPKEEKPPMKKIRFIHPVPSFVWKDMKEYGPFEAGEEMELFPEVAELIIEKGRAEEIA